MTRENQIKWLKNLLYFTAPSLAVFFYQLSQGAEPKVALPLAVFSFYAALADLLKKIGEN